MIVDASVLVSAFFRADVFHQRSRTWLRSQTGIDLIVPSLGVVELAGAISRVQGSPARALRLSRILRTSHRFTIIDLSEALIFQATDIAAMYRIRGADAIYVATALELGMPLVTLDQELQQRAASIITVIHP